MTKAELQERFEFRNVRAEEADQTIAIENICFPPNEACSAKSMTERASQAQETFLVAVDKETGKIAGFLNGIATDEDIFRDEFFTDITLHNRKGKNIMLLGLDVLPEYRGQGIGEAMVGLLIDRAIRDKISNIKLLTALKTMPAVVDRLCGNGVDIDGFIAPGHVCAVTGAEAFLPLTEKYNIPFAVSGFEAEEILSAIYALVKTIDKGEGLATVMNLYKSVVRQERNEKAFDIVNKYFVPCSASWRGLGKIESSGLILRDEYSRFDAGSADLTADFSKSKGCMCGEIITGKKTPSECPLFKKVCTPETPMGACMVSGEGTCFNLFIND